MSDQINGFPIGTKNIGPVQLTVEGFDAIDELADADLAVGRYVKRADTSETFKRVASDGDLVTSGGIELKKVRGFEYDSREDLEANIVSRGDGTVITTRKEGFSLTETSEADPASLGDPDGYHRQIGGINFYVNENLYDIKAEDWGVKLTGLDADAPSNTAILTRMFEYLGANGGGRVYLGGEGHVKVNLPPVMYSHTELDGGGALLENIRTRAEYTVWESNAALLMGAIQRDEMWKFDWHECDACSLGDYGITLSDSANISNYEVGQSVFIMEATDYVGLTGDPDPDLNKALPDFSQFAIIVGISGSTIYLERPIEKTMDAGSGALGVSTRGVWIANFDQSTRLDRPSSTDRLGGRPWLCVRPKLYDIRVKTQLGEGVGGYHASYEFDSDVVHTEAGAELYGRNFGPINMNGIAYGNLRNWSGSYFERAIEIKCLSHNTVIQDFRAYKKNYNKSELYYTENTITSFGEGDRNCVMRNGEIDTGQSLDGLPDGHNLIQINDSVNCGFENVTFKGATENAYGIYVRKDSIGGFCKNCTFEAPSGLGIDCDGVDPIITGNRFKGTLTNYPIRVSSNASGGVVENNHFENAGKIRIEAPASGDGDVVSVRNNFGITYIEYATTEAQSRVAVSECRDYNSMSLAQVPMIEVEKGTTGTTEVLIGTPRVIPSDTLAYGDIIELNVDGETSGSTGDKYIRWRCAVDTDEDDTSLDGDDDQNISGTITLPAPSGDWYLEARCVCKTAGASGQLIQTVRCVDYSTGDVLGSVARHVSADLTKPLRLELTGWVEVDGEGVTARSIRYSVQPRPGFSL